MLNQLLKTGSKRLQEGGKNNIKVHISYALIIHFGRRSPGFAIQIIALICQLPGPQRNNEVTNKIGGGAVFCQVRQEFHLQIKVQICYVVTESLGNKYFLEKKKRNM